MVPRVVPTAVAAVGLVLVVVGVVMLTLAAPPQRVGGTAGTEGVLVTGPGVLGLTGRAVEVEAPDDAFVGVGRAPEVEAWLDGVARTQVDGVSAETELATTEVTGDAPEDADPPADPLLADVWQQEQTGGDGPLVIDEPRPEQVLVVVGAPSDGTTITWDRPARHPGAVPLLVAGSVELVLGLLWLVALNARRRRTRRGPA